MKPEVVLEPEDGRKLKDGLYILLIGGTGVELTNDVELDDLLCMEMADADCTDVGALIRNLQLGQSHGAITCIDNLGSIYVCALSVWIY